MKTEQAIIDCKTMSAIGRRAADMFPEREAWMFALDVEHAHSTTPLDLPKLLGFDDGNFAHDISGIYNHLNRETCELEDCFLPRCSA